MPDKKERPTVQDITRHIEILFEDGKEQELDMLLQNTAPEDIAEALGGFSVKEKLRIFDALDPEDAAVVLDDTDPGTRLQILQKIDNEKLAQVLDEMPADEASDIVEDIPEKNREGILDLMEDEDAEDVEEILSYPEDSAARVMDPEFVSVSADNYVEEAIDHMRGKELGGHVFHVYVIDENEKLKGVVPIIKLITAPRGTFIKDIMKMDTHSVFADEDREKAALIMKKYDLFSLPVIDRNARLVGRITVDDIIDVMDEERGEDISRMTGTIEEEQGKETTLKATQNRLPWLVTCMLGSIVTGLVIRMYEVTLAETIALVSFIPVITATGGNSGVQASTVVVREIALGYMDIMKVSEEVWRQFKIALGLGSVCGIVLSVLAHFWMKNSLIGLVVGLSLFLVVVWSNFVGVVTPIVFRKIKIDPAIASGPLITTLNDVVGVFIYLTIASIFLR
ncbi:MAG: magnesium transporter [Candidatus Omnitrophota bacterium]